LSARCHLAVYLEFEEDAEPTCDIPHSEDPRWKGLGQPRNTRDQLQAAKIAVGDRTGKDPLETLALLAKSVRDAGGTAGTRFRLAMEATLRIPRETLGGTRVSRGVVSPFPRRPTRSSLSITVGHPTRRSSTAPAWSRTSTTAPRSDS
jgi:hypothetical protein